MSLILRDYQTALLDQARHKFKHGEKSVLVQAPTGSGKTALLTEMFRTSSSKGNVCWMVVHRKELIDQTVAAFKKIDLACGVVSGAHTRNTHRRVLVCGIDTLRNKHKQLTPPNFICFDECFVAGTLVDSVPIECIKNGDYVLSFDEISGNVSHNKVTHVFKKPAPDILYKIKIKDRSVICTGNHPFYVNGVWVDASKLRIGDELYVMRGLRGSEDKRGKVQVSKMLSHKYVGEKQSGRSEEDERKKSNAPSIDKNKDVGVTKEDRAQTKDSRWEWSRVNSAAKSIVEKAWMAYRSYCADWLLAWHERYAKPLQDRYSSCGKENSNRSRRKFALCTEETRIRQEERCFFEKVRVESIEISQRGDNGKFESLCPDGFVYNLEVENDNTYFANNILVHNCHHLGAQTWRNLYEYYPNAYKIGLTATPWRLDGKGLADFFSSIVMGPRVRDLINQGWLCDYKIYAPVAPDLSGIKSSMGDFVNKELFTRMNNAAITGSCINEYVKHASGKRGIVFAVNVEHSKIIMDGFNLRGIECEHIDATTHPDLRASAINRFKRGETKVLTNVNLFGEGFDLPDIECVMLMRPTKSLSLYLQMVGRALRPTEHKQHAIILDHSGNALEHNMPCYEHEWSLAGRPKKKSSSVKIKVCPKCYGAQAAQASVCAYCGHVFLKEKQAREIDVEDGELNEIDVSMFKKSRRAEQGSAQTLEDLVRIGESRGYKRARLWAKHVFNGRQRKKLGGL